MHKGGPLRILCLFGTHQYGNRSRGQSTESFAFIPALRKLGHEVEVFDTWDKSLHPSFRELNTNLVTCAERYEPHVIFWVAMLAEVWIETILHLRSRVGAKVVHWAPDDSWKFRQHSKFVAPYVDLCVTTYPDYLARYRSLGATAIHSGWGVPVQWVGKVLRSQECDLQVTFVGSRTQRRARAIHKLLEQGITVTCFGFGWPDGAMDSDDIPLIYRRSLISLNFADSRGINQLKARVFEVTGAGGFLLTEQSNEIGSVFTAGHEIETFQSLAECARKIRYYIENPSARDQIAISGNLRSREHYTYVDRLTRIFEELDAASHDGKKHLPKQKDSFCAALQSHSQPRPLRFLKKALVLLGCAMFGGRRGPRFARRLAYEISWRLVGETTYRARGWPGRMFYEE